MNSRFPSFPRRVFCALTIAIVSAVTGGFRPTIGSDAVSPEPGVLGLSTPEADGSGAGAPTSFSVRGRSGASLVGLIQQQRLARHELVDVEMRFIDAPAPRGGIIYDAVFQVVFANVHSLLGATNSEWLEWIDEMSPLRGRFIDIEVEYFNGTKRYSALFLENGDDYSFSISTTNTDSAFQARLFSNSLAGRSIVDFEAYTPDGSNTIRYAGLWVDDPKQPRTTLYYGLESAEFSDLLRPLTGRVIDFERYFSPLHGEVRYAVIVAMVPAWSWALWRNLDGDQLDARHADNADRATHLVDLESWHTASGVRYAGVWGNAGSSFAETAPIVDDDRRLELPADVAAQIAAFETGNTRIGFYARNVRTHQAFAYRETEPFYLASAAKTPIHIKLWREIQAGRRDPTEQIQYTLDSTTPEPWYVNDRCDDFSRQSIGLTSAQFLPCNGDSSDFGNSFELDDLDRAMMSVSDNSATSMLVDDPDFGLSFAREDVNEWLAGLDGVGREWWPVTSIHDVDRAIIWQSYVMASPLAPSFFLIPGWTFEPWYRNSNDFWGDLAASIGTPLPSRSFVGGHDRYYRMGLNSATPRGFCRLLEAFTEGELLDEETTEEAFDRMNEPAPLGFPVAGRSLPAHFEVRAKGGTKGGSGVQGITRMVTDTAVFRVGQDAIVLAVFTAENTLPPGTIRSGIVPLLGRRAAQNLLADLVVEDARLGTPTVEQGGRILAGARIRNVQQGDSVAFNVELTAQLRDVTRVLASERMGGLDGGDFDTVLFAFDLPRDFPVGQHLLRVVVDPPTDDLPLGEVGEFGEIAQSRFAGDLTVSAAGGPTVFRRGDANQNGVVDISDASFLLGVLFRGEGLFLCADSADVNDDGQVDVSDPIRLLGFLFLGSAAPPSPGTWNCGVDPTPDSVGCGESGMSC